jgi:hypothetical protein
MGTSASYETPSGGDWADVKRQITAVLSGGAAAATPWRVVGKTAAASGGLSFSGGHGGGAAATAGRNSIARVVNGVGGFGSVLSEGGLEAALASLGLEELRGRPAAEVIVAISEHLSENTDGLDRAFLQTALSEALIEAASLGGDIGYEDFVLGIESFVEREGPEGLVGLFLENLVFDMLWARIEQHAIDKSADAASLESLMAAVRGECIAQVQAELAALANDGALPNADWFGSSGRQLGIQIVRSLEARLTALSRA